MRLIELDPQFLRYEENKGQVTHHHVNTLIEAEGIMFLCPVCFKKNNGPIGTHAVICWSPKIKPYVCPKPGRWNMIGSGFHDLSLVAGSSSVLLRGGCNAHFFIKNGNIEIC